MFFILLYFFVIFDALCNSSPQYGIDYTVSWLLITHYEFFCSASGTQVTCTSDLCWYGFYFRIVLCMFPQLIFVCYGRSGRCTRARDTGIKSVRKRNTTGRRREWWRLEGVTRAGAEKNEKQNLPGGKKKKHE